MLTKMKEKKEEKYRQKHNKKNKKELKFAYIFSSFKVLQIQI